MKRVIYILFITFLFNQELPNDVRWVRDSSEYKMLCNQTYRNAQEKLEEYLLLNENADKNFAVIMDLDETVLDNAQYQVELFNKNETFNMESWSSWVKKEEATLVPGAYDYIQFLRNKDIQIIFISNRMEERLQETKNNIKKLDIYSDNDVYLLRRNKEDKKTVRREEVFLCKGRMEKYHMFTVLQYLGDAMGDFKSLDESRFGIDQFIFPNPMYGKW